MLVLAYADWCGHCKSFKPIWNKFKEKYQNVLDIREVNTDSDKTIMKNLGVNGFPTVIMLENGVKHDFNGPRTLEGLEKFTKNVVNSHLNDNLKNYRSA